MRIGTYRFAPPWWAWLTLLLVLAATLSLGRWQWNKAADKAARMAALTRMAAMPPQPLSALPAGVAPTPYRRLVLVGHWQTEAAIWLDNRVRDGLAGFELLMPLRVETPAGVRWVLVNRGWIVREARDRIAPAALGGAASLVGEVEPPLRRIIELSDQVVEGRVWQNVTPARFRARTGLAVEPYLVRQIGGAPDGLLRSWPSPDLGRDRNLGYALQWLALAVAAVMTFVVLSLRKSV